MRRRDVNFYNIKVKAIDVGYIQSKARELLLNKQDFDVGAAWVEAVLEHLKNESVLPIDELNYFSNGERRRK